MGKGSGAGGARGGGGGGQPKTLTERAASGELTTKELKNMDPGSRAIMLRYVPVGTEVKVSTGTTYTKTASNQWQPNGSVQGFKFGQRSAAQSSSAVAKRFGSIKYPRR